MQGIPKPSVPNDHQYYSDQNWAMPNRDSRWLDFAHCVDTYSILFVLGPALYSIQVYRTRYSKKDRRAKTSRRTMLTYPHTWPECDAGSFHVSQYSCWQNARGPATSLSRIRARHIYTVYTFDHLSRFVFFRNLFSPSEKRRYMRSLSFDMSCSFLDPDGRELIECDTQNASFQACQGS